MRVGSGAGGSTSRVSSRVDLGGSRSLPVSASGKNAADPAAAAIDGWAAAFVRNGSSHPAESQQPPGEVTATILPVVREQGRVQEGRDPEPSAALFDSQSVRGADTVGRDTRGDATSPAQAWSMPM